ncbi:uncharacterized protein N7469_009429 [Penicillium citrinum]|uniref:Uncharacterized protein n=1 Tax=Penicillium citrinum TaxID=5077 RepID=A0A9W9THZ7_PENCI|nr:uncharacterized protein N7469_009429 [Penicillium citrinum]KAJ5223189.1 hypothetical protein N7469_009429 [Penicillium citrinum]
MATESPLIFPPDIMESQLSVIDLLTAMFPSPGEMEIPQSTAEHVERLREWCQNQTTAPPTVPPSLPLSVFLSVSDGEKSIQVNISVPLQCENPNTIDQPPPSSYSLRQPEWMSKAEFSSIAAYVQGVDSLEALDYIQNRVNDFLESKKNEANATEQEKLDRIAQGPIRVFTGMEEITDTLGERSGQRANRGDMQALEAWLGSKGLQTAFEKVIF